MSECSLLKFGRTYSDLLLRGAFILLATTFGQDRVHSLSTAPVALKIALVLVIADADYRLEYPIFFEHVEEVVRLVFGCRMLGNDQASELVAVKTTPHQLF